MRPFFTTYGMRTPAKTGQHLFCVVHELNNRLGNVCHRHDTLNTPPLADTSPFPLFSTRQDKLLRYQDGQAVGPSNETTIPARHGSPLPPPPPAAYLPPRLRLEGSHRGGPVGEKSAKLAVNCCPRHASEHGGALPRQRLLVLGLCFRIICFVG